MDQSFFGNANQKQLEVEEGLTFRNGELVLMENKVHNLRILRMVHRSLCDYI